MSVLDRALTAAAFAALLLALTGCMVGPKYKTPIVPLPATFVGQDSAAQSENAAAIAEWWQGFGDAELTSLIRRAVSGSFNVENAAARLREARATWRYTADRQQLPAVATTGEFTRQRTSQDNPAIPKLGNAVNAGNSGLSNFPLIPTEYGVYQAYFDASYELDLWGAARHSVRASHDEAQSFEDNLRGKLVSTTAEVARDYLRLRQYQQQITNTESSLKAQRETLRLVQIRLKAGLVTDIDVANAAANVAGTQAYVPILQLSENKMIHALAVLIGQNPETLYPELSAPHDIPASRTELAIGLPSALLRRRPDIRQAERNLAAATERVGVQVASLFPTISLSARAGGQSGKFGNLATTAASFFQLGPQINWGILNHPAAKQDLRTYRARQEQQYLDYKQTVLIAFQDVDDSLVSYKSEKARHQFLQEQVLQNQRSVSIATEKYTRGLTNFLNVLDAQRSLLSSENAAIECRANVSVDLVALFKAVGGGWQTTYPVSVSNPPTGLP